VSKNKQHKPMGSRQDACAKLELQICGQVALLTGTVVFATCTWYCFFLKYLFWTRKENEATP